MTAGSTITRLSDMLHMKKQAIVIQGIRLSAHCGVTQAERDVKQPMLVDLRLYCRNHKAFRSDRISDTVDYGAVVQRVREIGEGTSFSLIETLVDRISRALFQEFPLTHVQIWARKIHPPLPDIQGSVGISISRSRAAGPETGEQAAQPASFLIRQSPHLPRGSALDLAAGSGRNSLFLAVQGYTVHAVDRDTAALERLRQKAEETGISSISTEILDLENSTSSPPDLGEHRYELILVFFYLFRPIFPNLLRALKPGGMILYETFLIDNHVRYQHPRRKEFCLQPNELLSLCSGLRILHYEEGPHKEPSGDKPAITARLLAQKPA
jgi:dihydroneopterin aldolase